MLMHLQHRRPDGEVDTYHLKPGRKYHLGRGSACELRILDLKLSRKHCCIEFVKGVWQIEDLGSTNGCKVSGEQIVGTRNLAKDHRIEAGTTTVTVAGFVDPQQRGDAESQALAAVQQEPLPEGNERSITENSLTAREWEPEPETENPNQTSALQPAERSAKKPATPVIALAPQVQSEGDGNITLAPNTMFAKASALTPRTVEPQSRAGNQPPPQLAQPELRTPPITVETTAKPKLVDMPATAETRPSPRIKPITIRIGRVDGDELHTPTANPLLEEPGSDTVATVGAVKMAAPITAPAPAPPQPATDSISAGDERTFSITVLGRRIGPLDRATARDLKARELKGLLTLDDLKAYPGG